MTSEPLCSPKPFTLRGKILYFINILLIALILGLGVYFYSILPEEIPVHFNIKGEPDAYGSKMIFIILPAVFIIGPLIIILISGFRFMLLNKYPFLINIPAFYTKIPKLPWERRGEWVNKYFEAVLALGLALSVYFLILLYGFYVSVVIKRLPQWFMPIGLLGVIAFIVPFIAYLYRLSKDLDRELVKCWTNFST